MIFNKGSKENYFDMFKVITEYALEAAIKFDNLINNYTDIEKKCNEIEEVEHDADKQVQAIYLQLNRSFITPIDREDIFIIAKRLDQICDQIDSAAQRFLMFDVEEITEESAKKFTDLIIKCCEHINTVAIDLKHFKKVDKINDGIRFINELEHNGDDLYHSSVKNLFKKNKDPLYVLKWKEMYLSFEIILDACEDAANTILGVVVKNS